MSTQSRLTLAGALLALTVLGCRNADRTLPPTEANPPTPTPGPTDGGSPLGEGDDDLSGERDGGGSPEVPPPVGEADPVDPDMPEAVDPGADPKQPPPPSTLVTRG